MARSIVFDKAVSYYDQTRGLAPEHAAALTAALIDLGELAGARRVLEVGVGTGLISAPLAQRGIAMTGIDLSRPMMKAAQVKAVGLALVEGDAFDLPFPAAGFDAVIMVHILHLVASWQEALLEAQRVLRSGGRLLHAWGEQDETHPITELRRRFFAAVSQRGISTPRPWVRDEDFMEEFLTARHWAHQTVEVTSWSGPESPQSFIESLGRRIWSATWPVDDATLAEVAAELSAWCMSEYGDLSVARPYQHRLMVEVVAPH